VTAVRTPPEETENMYSLPAVAMSVVSSTTAR
jgi:hypothetical protein